MLFSISSVEKVLLPFPSLNVSKKALTVVKSGSCIALSPPFLEALASNSDHLNDPLSGSKPHFVEIELGSIIIDKTLFCHLAIDVCARLQNIGPRYSRLGHFLLRPLFLNHLTICA